MPSERFYKLPEDKRNRIREAAMKEFSGVPMENVSINRIIKDAGISRGSFYTYFESKEDVLKYLSEDMQLEFEDMINGLLLECRGDFFAVTERFAEMTLQRIMMIPVDYRKTRCALFSGFSTAENLLAFATMLKDNTSELDRELWTKIDLSHLRLKSAEDLRALSIECRSLIIITVIKTMLFPETAEDNMKLFRKMLENLKTGVLC